MAIFATLKEEQRAILKQSFDSFYSDPPEKNGIGMFFRLFQENPQYKALWPQFRPLHDSHLFGAAEVKEQAAIMMNALKFIIENMDADDQLNVLFDTIAQKHIERGIEEKHMTNMRPALIDTLKSCLDDFSSETNVVWSAFLVIFANNIEKHKQMILATMK